MFSIQNLNRSSDEYYVIAEIGNNHGGSLDVCKEMFVEAKPRDTKEKMRLKDAIHLITNLS